MSAYTIRATFLVHGFGPSNDPERVKAMAKTLFSRELGEVLERDSIPIHLEVFNGEVSQDYLENPAAFTPDGAYRTGPDGLLTEAAMDAQDGDDDAPE